MSPNVRQPPKIGTPGLQAALLSLACTQLLAQGQLAITYDAQALGTMAFNVGLGTIVISSRSHLHLWIGSLTLLIASVCLAWFALQTDGVDKTGPDPMDVPRRRGAWTDSELEEHIVEDVRVDLLANERNLAAKARRVERALTFLLLALTLEVVGKLT